MLIIFYIKKFFVSKDFEIISFNFLLSFFAVTVAVVQRCSLKKGALKNFKKFTGKHLCQSLFLFKCRPEACNFIKKETLVQVFSFEFCEISKNTFFYITPLVATSEAKEILYRNIFKDIIVMLYST